MLSHTLIKNVTTVKSVQNGSAPKLIWNCTCTRTLEKSDLSEAFVRDAFPKWSHLARHMHICTGDKPFKCEYIAFIHSKDQQLCGPYAAAVRMHSFPGKAYFTMQTLT